MKLRSGKQTSTTEKQQKKGDSEKQQKKGNSEKQQKGNIELHATDESFKQFDIAQDYSDHHFYSSDDNGCFSNPSSVVHKKIMREWKILEDNLPDTIYVRVYEGKIDLLRAVIIGAAGTPYHDGLFFFDLAFPPDYPNRPPMVYYHAHGLRLNPNLYVNGTVCLSLINTWSGGKEEVWKPSTSTILQLLVSLQGLVLNEDPFFNEPGVEADKSNPAYQYLATEYTKGAFVSTCQTMLYLLQKPPKNFENFVAKHFCDRANVILAACSAYMSGQAMVGRFYDGGLSSASPSSSIQVSPFFKQSMDVLYPQLVEAFTKFAASLQEGFDQAEDASSSFKRKADDKASHGLDNGKKGKIST